MYRSEATNEEWQRLNGRYCGQAAPGPIESEMEAVGLRVVLRTDTEHVHSGFQAIYQFKKKDMLFRGEHSGALVCCFGVKKKEMIFAV